MADDYAEVYSVAMSGYQAAVIEEQAAYQRAALTGDVNEQVRASQSIAALRSQAREYQMLASEHAASMRPTEQPSKFGLSEAERETAKISGITEETYYANREKMRQMKAEGYWDQQGKVSR